ncbi:MAG: 50S ribosomal protein L13 [Simkaniaceae bacterium]|nr:50S ribosomal protein L13 [Simkaniaceae bacterium]
MGKCVGNRTIMLKKEEVGPLRRWLLLDARDKTLGRFAAEVAKILRGKHRVSYTPHVDTGDGVIVINASGIKVTGNKEAQKTYYRYTGHIGGARTTTYRVMMERKPTEIVRLAVKGMMPKTKQARAQMKRLRIFADADHRMDAQTPVQPDI